MDFSGMNKGTLLFERDQLRKQLEQIEEILDKRCQIVKVKSQDKAWNKLSLCEQMNICNARIDALDYFKENPEKTLRDFNKTLPKTEKLLIDEGSIA